MIKTPDVVNLDKSHVSFCGKAFRFRQEIERSLHETKSEISWNREAWVHETKSEFVEGRGERRTKLSRNLSKAGESAARNRVGIRRGKGKAGARNQVGTRREDGADAARNRVGIRRKQGKGAARNHVGIRRFAGGVLPVTASAFAIGQQGRGGSDFPRSGEKGGAGKEKSIRHKSDTFI